MNAYYFAVVTAEGTTRLYKCEYCLISVSMSRCEIYNVIYRNAPIHGFHEDYAFFVKGLLDLYEASFDSHWLEFAEELQDIQDRLFWDSQDGGYFAVAKSPILKRMKDCMFGCSFTNFILVIKCRGLMHIS